MRKMTDSTIGIDISKDRLDVHSLPDGAIAASGNDKAGLKREISWLEPDMRRVVFQPPGRYHLSLERRLTEAG
jgi:transposase